MVEAQLYPIVIEDGNYIVTTYSNGSVSMVIKGGSALESPEKPIPEVVQPTETELILMAAQAELFEHQIALEEQSLTIMEAQAEMYELLIPKESEVI